MAGGLLPDTSALAPCLAWQCAVTALRDPGNVAYTRTAVLLTRLTLLFRLTRACMLRTRRTARLHCWLCLQGWQLRTQNLVRCSQRCRFPAAYVVELRESHTPLLRIVEQLSSAIHTMLCNSNVYTCHQGSRRVVITPSVHWTFTVDQPCMVLECVLPRAVGAMQL